MLAICVEFGQVGDNIFTCRSLQPHRVLRGSRQSHNLGRENVAFLLQLGCGQ